MELSASLDTYRPNSAALFRSISAGSKSELIMNEGIHTFTSSFIKHIKQYIFETQKMKRLTGTMI
jgi:hypothetical protein